VAGYTLIIVFRFQRVQPIHLVLVGIMFYRKGVAFSVLSSDVWGS